MKVIVDGVIRPEEGAISALDRGILLGDGAFETLLVRDGRPLFLHRRLARLVSGLAALRIAPPEGLATIGAGMTALAAANGCARGLAVARATVTRGAGGRGVEIDPLVRPTLVVAVAPYAPPSTPAKVVIAERPRWSGAPTAFKAIGGYLDAVLARDDARRAGADEALLLNERGRIAGAAAANLFLIDAAGVLRTPSTADGALAGVVRGVLIEEARTLGIEVREGGIDAEALMAGEIFLTNALIGLRPAYFADCAPTAPSEVFRRLEARYRLRLELEAGAA